MKKLFVILSIILLTSCTTVKTVYVYPTLPEYSIEMPQKPELEEVSGSVEDVLRGMSVNTVKLMSYSEQLQVYGTQFKDFYDNLRLIYQSKNDLNN